MASLQYTGSRVKPPRNPEIGQAQTATAIPQPPETVRWLPAQTTLPDCVAW